MHAKRAGTNRWLICWRQTVQVPADQPLSFIDRPGQILFCGDILFWYIQNSAGQDSCILFGTGKGAYAGKERTEVMRKYGYILVLLMIWTCGVQADTLVQDLLERYERIETVTCDVRRDLVNAEGRMRWLSRVHFARPDRLHVENHAPLPRRIIADGETMYQHNEGQPRGFRAPIASLNTAMRDGLRKVPGTAMEHLLRIGGAPETVLPGELDDFPVRRAYATDTLYVVLHADADLRLGRIELFDGPDQRTQAGQIDFEAFDEVIDGVWIPMVHRGRFQVGGSENTETTRISNYAANAPMPQHLFQAESFFRDVTWVDSFDEL
jgi:hypothetical protein